MKCSNFSAVFVSFVLAIGISATSTSAADPVRVMSFNLRFGKANDGVNHWDKRKDLLAETIRNFDPDLLGTQETLQFQADFVAQQTEGYTYFGRSRMKTPNEHCGIFYRTARFTQLAGGHFWLSESPEIPESKSWDSSLPRMATWVLLSDHTDESAHPILMVNTHFDHRGSEARQRSAALIRKRVDSLKHLADDPVVIITGDFNTAQGSAPYKALLSDNAKLRDTYLVTNKPSGNEGTFNSWTGRTDGARIDWIIADSRFKVIEAAIDHTSHDGRNPSDHFPVTSVLQQ